MALLLDGELSSPEDLRAYDGSALDMAAAEGVDLKSKLDIAQRQIEIEVGSLLRREGCGVLEQVVATPALRRWHTLLTLEAAYRDAYFSQLNDRFGGRWKAYAEAAAEAGRFVMDDGVGLVRLPLPRPRRVRIRVEPGPTAPATYWLAATWVRGMAESAPSEREVVAATFPHWLTINALEAPLDATGWRVYAGISADAMRLQTPEALAPEQQWTMPSEGLIDGPGPGGGQPPESYCAPQQLLRRW
jgi:hypothetical protein